MLNDGNVQIVWTIMWGVMSSVAFKPKSCFWVEPILNLSWRIVKWRSFTGPKPQKNPKDGRNSVIFHMLNFSPSLRCFSTWCTVFLSPSLSGWSELLGCLWRFILIDVLLSGKSSAKAAKISAWELFHLEFLFFFAQITDALLSFFFPFTRAKCGEITELVFTH